VSGGAKYPRFWQFGGLAFLGGTGGGVLFGKPVFPVVLALALIICAALVFALAVLVRGARWAGEEAEYSVFRTVPTFYVAGAAVVAAFAGYGLGAMISSAL
jgi:hypothetical protein